MACEFSIVVKAKLMLTPIHYLLNLLTIMLAMFLPLANCKENSMHGKTGSQHQHQPWGSDAGKTWGRE